MSNKPEKNKKKEEKFQRRGYYSEILTDFDHIQPKNKQDKTDILSGAHKHTNLLWQVRTEKHAPIIQELPLSSKEIFLAPAQRWKTYEEEPTIVSLIYPASLMRS